MNRRRIILLIVVVLILAVAAVAALAGGRRDTPASTLSPSPSDTPTPSPSPSTNPAIAEGGDPGFVGTEDYPPALAKLPKETPYWSLTVQGEGSGEKLPLVAIVRYETGTNPEAAVTKQQPFIERYLRSIGQPPETYKLRIETAEIDSFISR